MSEASQLLWSGIGVATLIGIVLGAIEWWIDSRADRWQESLLPLRTSLAQFGCGGWVLNLIDALIAGDVGKAIALGKAAVWSGNQTQFFVEQIAKPVHDWYVRYVAEAGSSLAAKTSSTTSGKG